MSCDLWKLKLMYSPDVGELCTHAKGRGVKPAGPQLNFNILLRGQVAASGLAMCHSSIGLKYIMYIPPIQSQCEKWQLLTRLRK